MACELLHGGPAGRRQHDLGGRHRASSWPSRPTAIAPAPLTPSASVDSPPEIVTATTVASRLRQGRPLPGREIIPRPRRSPTFAWTSSGAPGHRTAHGGPRRLRPGLSHGVVDPISELSELALAHGLESARRYLFDGFFPPFARRLRLSHPRRLTSACRRDVDLRRPAGTASRPRRLDDHVPRRRPATLSVLRLSRLAGRHHASTTPRHPTRRPIAADTGGDDLAGTQRLPSCVMRMRNTQRFSTARAVPDFAYSVMPAIGVFAYGRRPQIFRHRRRHGDPRLVHRPPSSAPTTCTS